MAVIGGSAPSLFLIPWKCCKLPARSLVVCSTRWRCPNEIHPAGSAIGGRELYRRGQKAAHILQLHLPRASSGSSGEGGDGDEERAGGNNDDEKGQSDGIKAEDEGAADAGPGDDDKEGGGFWRSIWRRKTKDPDTEEESEESDSAASGPKEEEKEEVVETPSAERLRGWRFPWNWDAEREQMEQEAREEEAEEQRRKREGIFVFDVDNESLELRWKDLLDPTVENVLALILTGCLVLAIVQILWQLFVVAAAITVSAIKYTVLAIFLIGILVFLV
eukprot:TRINITY_DN13316_c0_g2_i1.p2 TRINITY_DN13316_c0_g2~~TRINITY_DN13316_c0_g2_i1.p2  ORF type:complete len:276 (-),score=54.15 TRINITY_DN13316_c0_g2_i1:690-1517(-)